MGLPKAVLFPRLKGGAGGGLGCGHGRPFRVERRNDTLAGHCTPKRVSGQVPGRGKWGAGAVAGSLLPGPTVVQYALPFESISASSARGGALSTVESPPWPSPIRGGNRAWGSWVPREPTRHIRGAAPVTESFCPVLRPASWRRPLPSNPVPLSSPSPEPGAAGRGASLRGYRPRSSTRWKLLPTARGGAGLGLPGPTVVQYAQPFPQALTAWRPRGYNSPGCFPLESRSEGGWPYGWAGGSACR